MLKWFRNTLRLAQANQECRHYEERYYRVRSLYGDYPHPSARRQVRKAKRDMEEARVRLAAARGACK